MHIYLQENGENQLVVSEQGNKGYYWINQQIETTIQNYKIIFKAIRGYSFESDIAVDKLEVEKGACKSLTKIIYPPKNIGKINIFT